MGFIISTAPNNISDPQWPNFFQTETSQHKRNPWWW